MRRGEGTLAAIAVGLVMLVLAAPAAAREAKFAVTYTGNGEFTSHTKGHIANDNGRCNNTATEDTAFSFIGAVDLTVKFSDKGMTGDSRTFGHGADDWVTAHNNPTEVTKVSSGPGCHPPDGSNLSGSYNCAGTAQPQGLGQSKFTLSAAGKGERSHLSAIGPAEFSSTDFSGQWVYDTGSCRGSLNGLPLLQTKEAFALPFDLGVRLPIREETLRTLPIHHYFRVNVGEGHYAPQVSDAQRCAHTSTDECKQTFDWTGRVDVRRVG